MRHLSPALAALAVGTLALCVAPARAADSTSIGVPAAGPKAVRTTFSGSFPIGTNAPVWVNSFTTVGCQGIPDQFVERHTINVTVPAGAYSLVKATMALQVAATQGVTGNAGEVELLDPDGDSVGADSNAPQLEIDVVNPKAGAWTLLTCQFMPDPQAVTYSATLTVKTTCKATSPCPTTKPKRRR